MKDLGDLVWVRANQGAPNIRTRDVGHEHNIVGWMGGRTALDSAAVCTEIDTTSCLNTFIEVIGMLSNE
jgi:hypothetical protein